MLEEQNSIEKIIERDVVKSDSFICARSANEHWKKLPVSEFFCLCFWSGLVGVWVVFLLCFALIGQSSDNTSESAMTLCQDLQRLPQSSR